MKISAKLLVACALMVVVPSLSYALPNEIFAVDRFEIGKSTLEEVQSFFGQSKSQAIERGDGADMAVCYSNGTSSSSPTILFETGALGAWKKVTAYRLMRRGRRQCGLTSVPLLAMSTRNGLKLNAKRQFVVDVLRKSKAATSSGVRIYIEEVYKRVPTDEEAAHMRRSGADPSRIKFDVVDTVEIGFRRGAVEDLYVKRLVSY